MGVPKFFRYISSRYPCLSEVLKEHQIPQFDNLYLDMNGIIHTCSHTNDSEVQLHANDEEIFQAIFHYIEVLFSMIQPQQLFFMAVDGVAPRAKINQQRGRRFRSARDAELAAAKAKAKGIDMPKEQKFDSNCITPGTEFMAKLSERMKEFIMHKINTEPIWGKCEVIYSGPEVPGEGEHKIMDYIRFMKSTRLKYDPNGTHCLYGLDADLIMLGLCTHEIHFSLLREEIKFSKKDKQPTTPEETRFCLLHLSLLREYINLEFSCLKEQLPFPYDLEKIIDDWVLMGFLVGNDFIPHLPNLHIVNGALPILHHAYMEVLPTLDGYINEAGILKLDRFEKFMEKLSRLDLEQFNELCADLKEYESKVGARTKENESKIGTRTKENESKVVTRAKESPKFEYTTIEQLEKDLMEEVLKSPVDYISKFSTISDEDNESDIETDFVEHKRNYYMNKMEYRSVDAAVLRSQAEGYVRAIQWNLHYYYHGCCSWSWYYPHHYAPYISDIKDFKDLKLEFTLGEPFLPFEQLLAVLPAYSSHLLPVAFQNLLTDEKSPILDYYPVDFKTDLNGKREEWEAVVLVPFIDEKRLTDAMKPHYSKLTSQEQERNRHGSMVSYSYLQLIEDEPTLKNIKMGGIKQRCTCREISLDELHVAREDLIIGLHPEARPDVYYPGFPTFQYIDYTASLRQEKVKTFMRRIKGESIILDILPHTPPKLDSLASDILGKKVYVSWPYLTEAEVVAISNSEWKINITNPSEDVSEKNLHKEEVKDFLLAQWESQKKHISETYKTCLGIHIGDTNILVHARPLVGRKYTFDSQGKLTLDTQWKEVSQTYAYQMLVRDIEVHDATTGMCKSIDKIFKQKSICFMLGHPHYGAMGEVLNLEGSEKSMRVKVVMDITPGPQLDAVIKRVTNKRKTQYMYGIIAAQRLGISSHVLSRITGTIIVSQSSSDEEDTQYNVGLNLKFNNRNEEIPGYTKKENGQWLYSTKAVELVRDYMVKCPDLFEKLAKKSTLVSFREEDLFNKETDELKTVIEWLKEQPYRTVERRSCSAEVLDPEMMAWIEKELEEFCKKRDELTKFVLMQVKPHLLFTSRLHLRHTWPDPNAKTYMLDRICCIRESYTVPLGSKGIVVGIHEAEVATDTMYDVIFDVPFTGGLTLNASLKNRGYRLSMADFINISHGERMQREKTWLTNVAIEPIDVTEKASNRKRQTQKGGTSAFASFNLEGSPAHSETVTPSSSTRQLNKVTAQQTSQSNSPQNVRPVQNTSDNVRSEFQALWNDLHKIQQKTATDRGKVTSNSPFPKGKQTSTNICENSPQDPSAFLKAMLKISDDATQNNAAKAGPTVTNKVPQQMPMQQIKSDAPPLVQQLFDQARKNEKKKDEKSTIWHCSQLLSYYQWSGTGMPRYRYLTNLQTNMVSAQILLPDSRIFTGDLCATHEQAAENAAKKVYHELNLDKSPKPDVGVLVPSRQWYNSHQNNIWQNIRPPTHMMPMCSPNFNQTPQMPMLHYQKWNPNAVHKPGFPPVPLQHSNKGTQPQSKLFHTESKPEIKNPMSFVPLQAQKKCRNATAKQAVQEQKKVIKPNSQVNVQRSERNEQKEERKKELKMEQKAEQKKEQGTTLTTPKVENTRKETTHPDKETPAQITALQQSPKLQKPVRPRRSRVAAKFGPPSVLNGGETQ